MKKELSYFNQLPVNTQFEMILQNGKFLMQRYHLNYHIELYYLDNFYVEIWRSVSTQQICWIQPQHEEYVLNTYRQLIQINPSNL